MIKLTDFNNICRLCLKKHDEQFVKLFFKRITAKSPVAEMVSLFCSVQIIKGDGLPEFICSHCWNIVSSMHELQTVSLKSDRLLKDILNSTAESESNKIEDIKIEFVETQSSVEKESSEGSETNSSVDDTTPLQATLKTEPTEGIEVKTKVKLVRKKREKNTSCEVCGKLVLSCNINFHLNAHKGIRPFKCKLEDCEKYFTSPANALLHFKKVHIYSITRPYKCDVCGSGFVQKSSLDTHITYHNDPQIPCPICGQLYRNKRALQRHSLVHSGERNFTCSECKKSFQTRFTLKTHMRIHTLEKPFSCTDTECTKSFAYKCLLKAHLEKYHRKG